MVTLEAMRVKAVRDILGIDKVHFQDTASKQWTRVFILHEEGGTIARLSFKNGELRFDKWFKRQVNSTFIEFEEADAIKIRLLVWFNHKITVQDNQITPLILWAKKEAKARYQMQLAAQKKALLHPGKGKVKKIALPNYHKTLSRMLGSNAMDAIKPVTEPPEEISRLAKKLGLCKCN